MQSRVRRACVERRTEHAPRVGRASEVHRLFDSLPYALRSRTQDNATWQAKQQKVMRSLEKRLLHREEIAAKADLCAACAVAFNGGCDDRVHTLTLSYSS
eukprot:1082674-Pleurochrysis_carterae.AAC.4